MTQPTYLKAHGIIDRGLPTETRKRANKLGISVRDATILMTDCYCLSGSKQGTREEATTELTRKAKEWVKARAKERFTNRLVRSTYGSIWIMLAMAIFSEIIKLLIAKWWDS